MLTFTEFSSRHTRLKMINFLRGAVSANRRGLMLAVLASLVLTGCGCCENDADGGGGDANTGGGDANTGGGTYEVNTPQNLSQALNIEGATRRSGTVPVPLGAFGGDIEMQDTIALTKYSASDIELSFPAIQANMQIGAIYMKVVGADDYLVIPVDTSVGEVQAAVDQFFTQTAMPCRGGGGGPSCFGIAVPPMPPTATVSEARTFPVEFTAAMLPQGEPCCAQFFDSMWPGFNDPSLWSSTRTANLRVQPVGTGDVQVTLTWNTTADVDLHVIEETFGGHIYYANPASSSGGYLDLDNTEGYGPENIFYEQVPPGGSYRVEVHHYSGDLPTAYTVTLRRGATIETFSGTLTRYDQYDVITTFTITSAGSWDAGSGDAGLGDAGSGGTGSGGTGSGGTGSSGGAGSGGSIGPATGAFGVKVYRPTGDCETTRTTYITGLDGSSIPMTTVLNYSGTLKAYTYDNTVDRYTEGFIAKPGGMGSTDSQGLYWYQLYGPRSGTVGNARYYKIEWEFTPEGSSFPTYCIISGVAEIDFEGQTKNVVIRW
ncbi:YfaP family protein [Marinimicrobium alkaliphilum]|uniref:YfaP family protein n=1 Tax=Marinimicrobium alkaliphilum TaxID=2202654 RepID=UPI0018E07248|nr:hypothetical protein [Marinimicrobium alkaliphilum]